MQEGPDAWSRFQKAMKTIVRVPKTSVVPAGKKTPKRKKTTKR
jgi:hypothetical protein